MSQLALMAPVASIKQGMYEFFVEEKAVAACARLNFFNVFFVMVPEAWQKRWHLLLGVMLCQWKTEMEWMKGMIWISVDLETLI